jgi:hypothetical protein
LLCAALTPESGHESSELGCPLCANSGHWRTLDEHSNARQDNSDLGELAGAAFTPDGKYLYIGNYLDQDLSILRVNGTKITPVKRFKLSGHPASIRMSTR